MRFDRQVFNKGIIMVALFEDDPKFDQKCKARGLDPEDVRRSLKEKRPSSKRDAGDKY
jgi:hypothetical protein